VDRHAKQARLPNADPDLIQVKGTVSLFSQ
jgi:hypothetical protein